MASPKQDIHFSHNHILTGHHHSSVLLKCLATSQINQSSLHSGLVWTIHRMHCSDLPSYSRSISQVSDTYYHVGWGLQDLRPLFLIIFRNSSPLLHWLQVYILHHQLKTILEMPTLEVRQQFKKLPHHPNKNNKNTICWVNKAFSAIYNHSSYLCTWWDTVLPAASWPAALCSLPRLPPLWWPPRQLHREAGTRTSTGRAAHPRTLHSTVPDLLTRAWIETRPGGKDNLSVALDFKHIFWLI